MSSVPYKARPTPAATPTKRWKRNRVRYSAVRGHIVVSQVDIRVEGRDDGIWIALADLCKASGTRDSPHLRRSFAPHETSMVYSLNPREPGGSTFAVNAKAAVRMAAASRAEGAEEFHRWLVERGLSYLANIVLPKPQLEPPPAPDQGGDPPDAGRAHRIPFAGTEVFVVDIDGKPWVVLKPAVEALGLSYSPQLRKLKSRSWAVMTETVTTGSDGKTYSMVVVDVDTMFTLLTHVNENLIAPEKRPALIAYQREMKNVISDYWTKGVAVNPRRAAAVGQASGPSTEPVAQAAREEVAPRNEDLIRPLVSRLEAYENENRVLRERLDALVGGLEWTTAAEYARRHGLEDNALGLSRLAGSAREVAHAHGLVPIVSKSHGLPPVVQFPDWVWAKVAKRPGLQRKEG